MSLRPDPTEPAGMSPEERLDEVAGLLARGILRLHGRIPPSEAHIQIPLEPSPTPLEVPASSRPDGVVG